MVRRVPGHRRVGSSNYRIDLAVVDPEQPNRYLLGIECDGAMYAAAATARERDRLRQQVLEQLGWKMQRIWSHDWISNPAAEVEKIMVRLREPAAPAAAGPADSAPVATPTSDMAAQTAAAPATTAGLTPEQDMAAETFLAKTQTPEAVKDLPTYVWPYLYAKLPTHTGTLSQAVPPDLVDDVVRIGTAWQVSRLTAKAKQLVNTAVDMAVQAKRIERRGDFLWPNKLVTPIVRAPKNDDKVRPIEHIAPEEIAEAAVLVVQEARSLSEADLITQTARLLGYARVTKKIDAAVTAAIETLKANGRIEAAGGLVHAGPAAA